MDKKKSRFILIIFVLISSLLDLGTFLFSNTKAFETSPFYVFTQSIYLVVILKIVIMGIFMYILYIGYSKDMMNFLFVLLACYITVAQIFGAVSNLATHESNPSEELVMEPRQAVEAYAQIQIRGVVMPMILALVAFKFWKWGYDEL